MIKTLDYKLVIENNYSFIGKRVLEYTNKGYDLFGTPFINMAGYYCQCVVKIDRSDELKNELKKVHQVLNSFVDMEKGEKKKDPLPDHLK